MHVVDADRDPRNRTGLRVTLPQRALLLDAAERRVEVGDVHAGAHVLEGQPAEAPAVRAGHPGRIAARRGGCDEFAQRPIVDGRLEAVEGLTHVEEQPEEDAELCDGFERPESRLRDERAATLEQPWNFARAEALCEIVRPGRFVG
jgi:hypothetical protein